MTKTAILTAIATAAALAAGTASADSVNTSNASSDMEKCPIVQAGKGMIEAGKADCKSSSHSCAGKNVADDPLSWIWVPTGQCIKANQGDFRGLPEDTQADIVGTEASGDPVG